MPISFKTEAESEPRGKAWAEKLSVVFSLGAIMLSLAGFGLSLRAIRSIHPQKPVEISCNPDMVAGLGRSADRLDKVRLEVLKNKTIK